MLGCGCSWWFAAPLEVTLGCDAGLFGVGSGWLLGMFTFVMLLGLCGGYLVFTAVVKILLSHVSAFWSVSSCWTTFVVNKKFMV